MKNKEVKKILEDPSLRKKIIHRLIKEIESIQDSDDCLIRLLDMLAKLFPEQDDIETIKPLLLSLILANGSEKMRELAKSFLI